MKLFISISGITEGRSLAGKDGHCFTIGNARLDVRYKNTQFAPRTQSVIEFVVPEDQRGQKIGQQLLTEALKKFHDLGAQVSSEASLHIFYKFGFRHPADPSMSFEQLRAKLHEDSSVFMASNDGHGNPYIR